MQVKDDMEDTFPKCREISMKFCRSRNIVVCMTQSISQTFCPHALAIFSLQARAPMIEWAHKTVTVQTAEL